MTFGLLTFCFVKHCHENDRVCDGLDTFNVVEKNWNVDEKWNKGKGRLQYSTAGSGRLSLFRIIKTSRNRMEPPVNRRLALKSSLSAF